MMSVSDAAVELGVSPARVRKLIADGALPARKAGHVWVLREEDVMDRLASHARAGRPKRFAAPGAQGACGGNGSEENSQRCDPCTIRAHELYRSCKELFCCVPGPEFMSAASSSEEAAFYMAVTDFFLQQKQRELIAKGVF